MFISTAFLSFILLAAASIIWIRARRMQQQARVEMNTLKREKDAALAKQASALAAANACIEELNRRLDAELARRSEQIVMRDQKILEYAHFNSHRVRGPLARIMGLTNLLHNCELGDDAREIINLVDRSSSELDGMVKEINRRILADSVN